MAGGRFARAAAKLLRAIGEEECAVAGGMAVNAHGFIRATRDVDVIVTVSLEEARRRLQEHGIRARLFRGDLLEGDFPCLKGVVGGAGTRGATASDVPFDVIPPLVPLDPERTIELEVRGHKLRVVDLETLVRLKLKAGSVRDLYDVAILILLHAGIRDRATALTAHEPALGRRLADLLGDPRVRDQAREQKRQDAILRRGARRGSRARRRKT
jgi:hypothetical protein